MGDGNGQPATVADVELTVPARLVEVLPADLRVDDATRNRYLLTALEIGVQAISHAGVHLDTSIVRHEFDRVTLALAGMQDGLERLLCDELTDDDSRLARALREYLSEEGRLARSLRQLCDELGDPTRDGSIPGRVRAVLDSHFRDANSPFQRALNIADDNSPLKRFVQDQEKKLKAFTEEMATKHAELVTSIGSKFQTVFDHIGYKAELDEAEEKGHRKGGSFEDDVTEFLNSVTFGKDAADRVGEELIEGTRRKRGDVLIRIQQDGIDEQRIVVEAKRGGYNLGGKKGVLSELAEAMQYRLAAGGIVVVTKQQAGAKQRPFDRRGSDRIIVVVDPDDEAPNFLPLEVAYTILRERIIAERQRGAGGGVDLAEMEHAVTCIENALGTVQAMKGNCTSANRTIDSIRTSIEELEQSIREQLRLLRKQVETESTT